MTPSLEAQEVAVADSASLTGIVEGESQQLSSHSFNDVEDMNSWINSALRPDFLEESQFIVQQIYQNFLNFLFTKEEFSAKEYKSSTHEQRKVSEILVQFYREGILTQLFNQEQGFSPQVINNLKISGEKQNEVIDTTLFALQTIQNYISSTKDPVQQKVFVYRQNDFFNLAQERVNQKFQEELNDEALKLAGVQFLKNKGLNHSQWICANQIVSDFGFSEEKIELYKKVALQDYVTLSMQAQNIFSDYGIFDISNQLKIIDSALSFEREILTKHYKLKREDDTSFDSFLPFKIWYSQELKSVVRTDYTFDILRTLCENPDIEYKLKIGSQDSNKGRTAQDVKSLRFNLISESNNEELPQNSFYKKSDQELSHGELRWWYHLSLRSSRDKVVADYNFDGVQILRSVGNKNINPKALDKEERIELFKKINSSLVVLHSHSDYANFGHLFDYSEQFDNRIISMHPDFVPNCRYQLASFIEEYNSKNTNLVNNLRQAHNNSVVQEINSFTSISYNPFKRVQLHADPHKGNLLEIDENAKNKFQELFPDGISFIDPEVVIQNGEPIYYDGAAVFDLGEAWVRDYGLLTRTEISLLVDDYITKAENHINNRIEWNNYKERNKMIKSMTDAVVASSIHSQLRTIHLYVSRMYNSIEENNFDEAIDNFRAVQRYMTAMKQNVETNTGITILNKKIARDKNWDNLLQATVEYTTPLLNKAQSIIGVDYHLQ